MMRRRIAKVLETSTQPRGALLAFLAIEGLMALEWLGLHRWQTEERGKLIAEIGWLADQQPEPAAISVTAWEKPSPRSQARSEEHTSELQSLMRTSYAVFCLKTKQQKKHNKR